MQKRRMLEDSAPTPPPLAVPAVVPTAVPPAREPRGGNLQSPPLPQSRIVVHNACMVLVVDDVARTVDRIADVACGLGGWVVNSDRRNFHLYRSYAVESSFVSGRVRCPVKVHSQLRKSYGDGRSVRLAEGHQIHPGWIRAWKGTSMDSAAGIFRKGQELKTKTYAALIALQYPETSFYGFGWMKAWLDREERPINRKRLRR